jgi:hypothetical protein
MIAHRQIAFVLALCVASIMMSACSVRETIIHGKQSPDEFAVYTRAPLSIPPDYSLRVPEPGADRPQEANPETIARQVVLGTAPNSMTQSGTFEGSVGTLALLRNTNALNVDPSIRDIVNQETSVLAEESQTVVDAILSWGSPSEYGSVVDPVLESKRIQENMALGQPLTTGVVPTITKENKSVIDSLF